MIYKKLKDLTYEALRDGELTVEEESRLMARAREMGQDLDEFRSYLEAERKKWVALIAEREKEKKEQEKLRQERENRPAYVKLSEEISRYESNSYYNSEEKARHIKEELGKVIIPTDQEGLFQLVNYLFSQYSHGSFNYLYKSRLKECLSAGRLSFPDDKRFESIETAFKKKLRNEWLWIVLLGIGVSVIMATMAILENLGIID